MAMVEALRAEFDHEMIATRRELERVPEKDAAWKPHPKSCSLGDLAAHLANVPSWLAPTLTGTELDFAPPGGPAWTPPRFTTVQDLLATFDTNVAAGREALAKATDPDLGIPWTLKGGGKTIFTLPRAAVVRSFVMSHLIHHRAQLGVYLRMRGVPLPGIYGPTADEGM